MSAKTTIGAAVAVLMTFAATAAAQDVANSRAMPGNVAPAGPYIFYWGPLSDAHPKGRPENDWRYRLRNGRWWFWTVDDNWSYFNGDTWVPYSAAAEEMLQRGPLLGPISGDLGVQGVIVQGPRSGLTLIAGDHAAAPHLRRGTVLPRYLEQAPMPEGVQE